MAYGNWGAFVYRNGERMRDWEDQSPYQETTLVSGYHQAFGMQVGKDGQVTKAERGRELGPHHAVLGQQRIRLCGYKCYPVLLVDGKRVELEPYCLNPGEDYEEHKGEIDGYVFTSERGENSVHLYLREPDGTVWTSTCGYEMGAGFED